MARSFLIGLLLASLSFSAFAQVGTPAAGSAERKVIMDALRVPARRDLGFDVIFKVQTLRLAGDWAFARVIPILPGGKEIDYSKTKYAEQMEEGAFDAEAETLLRREGNGWRVLEWRFGATDTEIDLWLEKYRFPEALIR
jgi:hypothetical protein